MQPAWQEAVGIALHVRIETDFVLVQQGLQRSVIERIKRLRSTANMLAADEYLLNCRNTGHLPQHDADVATLTPSRIYFWARA
tara:strand:- start:26131 stop:26379 length:249 start_codon:yes stop_codon:yes gene_type:complete